MTQKKPNWKRLKENTDGLGLERRDTAAMLGISQSYLSEILSDLKRPGMKLAKRIQDKFPEVRMDRW